MSRSILRRAVAPLALAATALTVGARRAGAQPACAPDALSSYLVSGFVCKLGHFTFGNFSYVTTILAATNATVHTSDPDEVFVLPVNSFAPGLGFVFFDLGSAAPGIANGVEATTDALDVDGWVRTEFSFDFAGDAFRHVRNAGYGLDLLVDKADGGGQFDALAQMVGDVRGPSDVCLDNVTHTRTRTGETFRDPHEPCVPNNLVYGTAAFTFESRIHRTGTNPAVTIDGFAGAALGYARIGGISAVPEPATVALVGGGLLGLAGIAARRRRG